MASNEIAKGPAPPVVHTGMSELRWTADEGFEDGTVWDLYADGEHVGYVLRPIPGRGGYVYPCMARRYSETTERVEEDFATMQEAARWLESVLA